MDRYFRNKNAVRWIFVPALLLLLCACHKEVFVECESFDHKGGWVVDPQFVEQMGSPYLMAHGLGKAVEDASTSMELSSGGKYHVWARTTDWASGPWEAPGQFNIWLNEVKLPHTMGSYRGWGWNYAGKVKLKAGELTVRLEDLTGFNGRCDAIYISNKYRTPTNQQEYLEDMRNRFAGYVDKPEETRSFDLVVVGGGLAGCAASIAAAEQGLKVALIHDRPVLGGNASSEIRVHTLGIYGHFSRILKMLDTEHYPNGSPEALADEKKRHQHVESYSNISLFLNFRAYQANTEKQLISSVDARHTSTSEALRFEAPYFVDCTGDGWIGYWAGAEYNYGREPDSLYGEAWEQHGELWSPVRGDHQVMGASLLWRTMNADTACEFPEVPWAMEVSGSYSAREGTWNWELISERWHQTDHAEQIRDHMLKAIFGSFYNEKQKAGNDSLKLEWVSYLLGKRESRRLVGDYLYTFNDMRESRSFPDAVVHEVREVDVHYPQSKLDESKPDFLSEAMYYPARPYQIPYRSLYSKNIGNLFMAGRCFSCSHIGLGGPRVMRTTGQMGAAVGYAASLCKLHQCTPRELYENHLAAYMELILTSDRQ
ncbi:MAG: FAD-dependent oxidoreductase [Bacteroidales bacterium]|nr:FAD-dependent oxidoreductase [Bacteroidales bacterium]